MVGRAGLIVKWKTRDLKVEAIAEICALPIDSLFVSGSALETIVLGVVALGKLGYMTIEKRASTAFGTPAALLEAIFWLVGLLISCNKTLSNALAVTIPAPRESRAIFAAGFASSSAAAAIFPGSARTPVAAFLLSAAAFSFR